MRRRFRYSIGEMTGRLLHLAAPVAGKLTLSTLASVIGNLSQMGICPVFSPIYINDVSGRLKGIVGDTQGEDQF